MAGLFDTSTVAMRATSTRVVADAEAIRADLGALMNRLAALEGAWIGEGRTAFASSEARFAEGNAKLNAALGEIGRLISTNEARYTADDDAARSGIGASAAGFAVAGF